VRTNSELPCAADPHLVFREEATSNNALAATLRTV
jgi:hypothetical protein